MLEEQGTAFTRAQDERINNAHREYLRQANEFLNVWENTTNVDEQEHLLLQMHAAGTAFYRAVEGAVFDRGDLSGDEFEAWKNGWTASVRKILYGLPRYHENLRHYRDKLGLPITMFEPPNGAYELIQQFFAATSKNEVPNTKAKFRAAKLPITGFDRPYAPKPARKDMKTSMPLFIVIVCVFGFLALACIGGGVYAIYHAAIADTNFDFLGFHLKTGHVGVAFVGIGLATAYFTTKAVLKTLQ